MLGQSPERNAGGLGLERGAKGHDQEKSIGDQNPGKDLGVHGPEIGVKGRGLERVTIGQGPRKDVGLERDVKGQGLTSLDEVSHLSEGVRLEEGEEGEEGMQSL